MPNEGGCFISCKPPVMWLTFWRQRHPYDAAMKSLVGVVVDRRPKGFEIAARTALVAAVPDVLTALMRVHGSEHLAAPEIVEAADPRIQVVSAAASLAVLASLSNYLNLSAQRL